MNETAGFAAADSALPLPYPRAWVVPIARAAPAAAAAIIITFTGAHSAALGFIVFGGFAVLAGLAIGVLNARAPEPAVTRSILVAQGAVTVVAGLFALFLMAGEVSTLMVILTTWAAITGFLELYVGLRTRGANASSRDWVFVGALTAVFAIAVLFVPPGLDQSFSGQNNVSGVVTASVVVVGAFGVYVAILAVYLVIAGLSLKWVKP
jgi:hypothetical protein